METVYEVWFRQKSGNEFPFYSTRVFENLEEALDDADESNEDATEASGLTFYVRKVTREDVQAPRYIIECPARCTSRGCTDDHGNSGWRKSASLPLSTTKAEAEKALAEHAARYPMSGPYRLTRKEN